MSKNFIIILNCAAALLLLTAGILYWRVTRQEKHVHLHAGFHLYVDGKKQDFSDFKYMSFAPCSTGKPKKQTPEEKQVEKAHLHDSVGDVVHVHHEGATWGDLLNNIGFQYDKSQEVIAYRDSAVISDILSQPISNHESIVIVFGDQSGVTDFLNNKVSLEAIKKVEQTSELCGASEG